MHGKELVSGGCSTAVIEKRARALFCTEVNVVQLFVLIIENISKCNESQMSHLLPLENLFKC